MRHLIWIACVVIWIGPALAAEDLDFSRQASDLRAAILDLVEAHGSEYPGGAAFLEELRLIEQSGDSTSFQDLARRALIANPLVSGSPILFVERRQYPADHHNTGNIFQTGEINTEKFHQLAGGALRAVDVRSGEVQTLVTSEQGTPRDPEVHFGGRRIVFALRQNIDDDYHIYEIGADGEGLCQITSAPGVSDLDPFYLADDHIAFSSTREPKYCTCNRHIMANLYRMEPDGANIQQIGKSIEFEGHGAQLPDGRLLYFRWEYVDRNFGGAQGLWVGNPDGTRHGLYYGQSTPHPVLNARPIPGGDLVVCVLSSCHDRPWGALAILDRRQGSEGSAPIARIWPASARSLIADAGDQYAGSGGFDNFTQIALKYEDPYPVSETTFLVSRMLSVGTDEVGLFLVDTFGNEVLLHRAAVGFGCFDPMPLAARPRPRLLPESRDQVSDEGSFYVADVYQGSHMQGVEPGSIRALRVVENPPKLTWTGPGWNGQGQEAPAMNWHDFDNKMILGTVPVEADGSAYFSVPSGRFVYFQLLNQQGRMVHSMRSGVVVQPGELRSCVGCHEDRDSAPKPSGQLPSLAQQRPPSHLEGWYGAPREFGFMAEVQPVLTGNCTRCHDYGQPAGQILNLAPDRTLVFNTAYMELQSKGWLNVVGGGPNRILQANSWGAQSSGLIRTLDHGHYDVELAPEDLDRLVTWIDLNAPYYATHASAHEQGVAGRSPLLPAELEELQTLTGKTFQIGHGARVMINLDRPELSPVLADMERQQPEAHQKALALIERGRQRLRKTPRADMEGFVPCQTDRVRLAKYERLQAHQERIRRAIQFGEKVYDKDRLR